MNRVILLVIIVVLASFREKERAENANQIPKISFKIEGELKGGENLVLALVIPSESEDNRRTCKVVNGKFSFEGTKTHEAMARIMFEEDVVDFTGAYSSFAFVLSEGTTRLRYEVKRSTGKTIRYVIENLEILSGDVAREFKNYQDSIFGAVFKGIRVYSDPVRSDSINRHILPSKRKAFAAMYGSIRDSIRSPYNKMKLLELVAFSPLYKMNPYLLPDDRAFVLDQFKALENEIKHFGEYAFIAAKFHEHFESPALAFSDHELIDLAGKPRKLSAIISENAFTVLYFWWTHCFPCRTFNKTQSGEYAELRKAGIEFVSINTDNGKAKWANSSKTDKIPWINLYAGPHSTILPLYHVNSYPTKIILTRDFKIVDFDFESLRDLQELASQH